MVRIVAGVLIGAGLGAVMGHFGKCSTGTCPLTANPFRGALWGGFLGLLFTMSFPHRPAVPVADSGNVHVIQNEDDFRSRVLESNRLCLVDFFADWCAPCQMLSPTIATIADQYVGKVSVCKVNVEDVASVAQRYKVNAIPKVILFENGQPVQQAEGVRSERFYRAMLDARLHDSGETEN
ncbi:MAG: thioredoxin [Candidatus Hydrogenedentes bacterium]|nr:thioredoxin [Candidatus Hydrogenedentota bacterium]